MSTTKIVLIIIAIVLIALYTSSIQRNKATVGENRMMAAEFLAENAKKAHIITTESGLQYEVLTQGQGQKNPLATSKVKVHYHGTLADGTVFDSSVERGSPFSFQLNQVIPGWTEGVQLMTEGSKFKFYMRPDLGYGDRPAGKIPPGSLLIFEVELLKIES